MIRIAVADTLKPTLQAYLEWMQRVPGDVGMVTLSCVRKNLDELDGCSGLVLTGGGDVHPKFYGREEVLPLAIGVNESRDEFEFALIRKALDDRLPILGVCRGMQAFNVALGGTLIPDVQAAGYQNHGKERGASADSRHGVRLDQNSNLQSITGPVAGEVNSSHHQAVEKPGRGLRVTVWSPDGVAEGVEWDKPDGKPFLQLVQWHPERMQDFENPLSRGLLERFVKEVQSFRK